MNPNEIRQIVWQEMGRLLSTVLTGVSQAADGTNESIQVLLPGVPTIPTRPVAFPWGYAARTPDGVSQLILQGGNSPSNRIISGHFDSNRPPLGPGECILYNQYGQQIYLKNGSIHIGTQAAAHPMLLGDIVNTFLQDLVNLIVAHTHAAPGVPPTNAAAFTTLENNFLSNNAIESGIIFGV